MKSATRLTSTGQVVIPKPVRERLQWESLYGCLKDLPRDPLADLEAEHQAEIEADELQQRRGR